MSQEDEEENIPASEDKDHQDEDKDHGESVPPEENIQQPIPQEENKKVLVVSRLDHPVTIIYGGKGKRLQPRFNDYLELSKLPTELPKGLQIV